MRIYLQVFFGLLILAPILDYVIVPSEWSSLLIIDQMATQLAPFLKPILGGSVVMALLMLALLILRSSPSANDNSAR